MSTTALEESERYSASGATAPRVSLGDMEAKIKAVRFMTAGGAVEALGGVAPNPLHLLTLCFIVMHNGFTVVGKSAPASADNFDKEKGETFAYEDAIRQLWPLEGYALREKLSTHNE